MLLLIVVVPVVVVVVVVLVVVVIVVVPLWRLGLKHTLFTVRNASYGRSKHLPELQTV